MIYEDYNSLNEFEVLMVKGEKGDKGDTGPAGADGRDGANGTGSWGNLQGDIYSQTDLMNATEYITPTAVSVSGFTMPSGYTACGLCWDGTSFYLNIYKNGTDSKIVKFDSSFQYIETKTIPDIAFGFRTISHKRKSNGHNLLILSNIMNATNHNAYGFDYEDETISVNAGIRDNYLDGLSSNNDGIVDVLFFRNDLERAANGNTHYITGMLTRRSNKLFIYSSDSYNYCNWGPQLPNPDDYYFAPFTVSDIPVEDVIISMCRHAVPYNTYTDYTTLFALSRKSYNPYTLYLSVFGLDGSLYKKFKLTRSNFNGMCYGGSGSLYLSTTSGSIYKINLVDTLYTRKPIYFKNPCYLYTKTESRILSHNTYKETTHSGTTSYLLTAFYLNSLTLLDARGVRNLVNHAKGVFGSDGWFNSFETYNEPTGTSSTQTRLEVNLKWISSENKYENTLWIPFVHGDNYLHFSIPETSAMGYYRSPAGALTRLTGIDNILANVFYGNYTNEIEYLIAYPTIPELENNGELSTYDWN